MDLLLFQVLAVSISDVRPKTAILDRRRLFEGKLRQTPSWQWLVQRGVVLGTSLIKRINDANISLEINISLSRLFHEDLSKPITSP